MQQLIKCGKIKPRKSSEIKYNRIGLGFEKLDRDVFDPEKAYDKVAETGVKFARIQSGWQRTETKEGVYDFDWIESIIDNLTKRGIEPWVCLCYGNELYNEFAKTVFGAVGCPPITNEKEKQAWLNYVKSFTKKFADRVNYFEIWNEPDGEWCWKSGVNAKEYGEFARDTAIAVKSVKPEAKVIGGVVCQRGLDFLNTALKVGMAEYIDYISFHEYTHDETAVFEKVDAFKALLKTYNSKIELIQGESGSQSKSGGHGALNCGAWTEQIQAKQLARHTIADLMCDVNFTSYFSCMDMIEALNGTVGNKNSYLDYGYFGILGADFDEDGKSTGEYFRKPSFYVLQNICSVFSEDVQKCSLPIIVPYTGISSRKFDVRLSRSDITSCGFKKDCGKAFVYWHPSNIMTTSFESEIVLEVYSEYSNFKIADIMDGTVYDIPKAMIEDKGNGVYRFNSLPVKDTPLILTMGEFLNYDEQ